MLGSFDSLRRSARGSRSSRGLLREVGELGSGRAEQVAAQLAEKGYDPKRYPSLYKDRLREVLDNEKRARAAEGAAYGSIAASQDPNRYGTVASTKYKSLYRG